MSFEYFERTDRDAAFYDEKLAGRLPDHVFDVHTHISRPQFMKKVSEEQISSTWSLEVGFVAAPRDLDAFFGTMFPGIRYEYNAFPFPLPQANIKASNKYVAECIDKGWIRSGFLCSTPEYDADYLERLLLMDSFSGMKVLPDVFSRDSRQQAEIQDLVTAQQLELAEQMARPVLLHVPRGGGLADPRNIADLRRIKEDFPQLPLIIAHFGSSGSPAAFADALDQLEDAAQWLYFDCSMVQDPAYYDAAFEKLPVDHILFGTDEPISLWHGRQILSDTGESVLVVREEFRWNGHVEGVEAEKGYSLFVYEQIASLLDSAKRHGLGAGDIERIFAGNALELLGIGQGSE